MERISVFDIFKIGVGPSSSHTMGPWIAAKQFANELIKSEINVGRVKIGLFGSLAKTGKGHGTDIAVIMGLWGTHPKTVELNLIEEYTKASKEEGVLAVGGGHKIPFDYSQDLIFDFDTPTTVHANTLRLTAFDQGKVILERTYYSIGGGFIQQEGESQEEKQSSVTLPHPIDSGEELESHCREVGKPIWKVVWENEKVWRSEEAIEEEILAIWDCMKQCVYRGVHTEGILPGGLNVDRRAAKINKHKMADFSYDNWTQWSNLISNHFTRFDDILKWVSCFALAVNEENAAFGRVVTAPTNGAAGVIPAVLHYLLLFCNNEGKDSVLKFILTAGELGSIFKKGSTISAAMGGCQAEIGVSSAMAAGALVEALGGSPKKALMAAEIAMEHHLGLTCDPIGGLVQIPCIERNSMGAIKAITAAQLALDSDPDKAIVSLDSVVRSMWETAQDMNSKYKETAEGGLAINVPVSLPEC